MQTQTLFLLGPAGSGKTYRCLEEIRLALKEDPDGEALVLLTPKQATFQLERQLLAGDGSLPGYSRLQILSFDRLARFVFQQLNEPLPALLTEEGRVMVLRSLLERKRDQLHLFRASSRLPGFARRLSLLLKELQSHCFTVAELERLEARVGSAGRLDHKLQDIRLLLGAYLGWLRERNLKDADQLAELAAEAVERRSKTTGKSPFKLAGLWLDGFARLTPQERRLLNAVVPHCQRVTTAFCLDAIPTEPVSWHSPWNLLGQTFRQCYDDFRAMPECAVAVEVLDRRSGSTRMEGNPALQHLEQFWASPRSWEAEGGAGNPGPALRVVRCANPEAEATLAAREILRFVRGGGRFRDTAVMVRDLTNYHDPLRRVFSRYQIPFFLDRRESVAHHPLAELTRNALRTVANGWRSEDWFGALKSGLVPAAEGDLDWLENEALARGWEEEAWMNKLKHDDGDAGMEARLEELRKGLVRPFLRLRTAVQSEPAGRDLADAIKLLWEDLAVAQTLEQWSREQESQFGGSLANPVHSTVWEQMQEWLNTLALAFPEESMPLKQWLPIIEAGLSSLTVGVIPPVLDQVLIGAIDRSRNPDLHRLYLLGVNETVFPALPPLPDLLTRADREQLEREGRSLGLDPRTQLGHEQFLGYIACTRAREAVVLTMAVRDAAGVAVNPSSFFSHLKRLFPDLEIETFDPARAWWESEHACELVTPLLRAGERGVGGLQSLRQLPVFQPILSQLGHLRNLDQSQTLAPGLAGQLYGSSLQTSVSRIEQFAACPFRFFVNSGLQAEERIRFELDVRQQGSFQHDVLAKFHEQVVADGKKWRDLTPAEASARIGRTADELIPAFEQGMLEATPQNRFMAEGYKEALQQFIQVLIRWTAQYRFDPEAVELGFGLEGDRIPAWELDLGRGNRLAFRGRIDRIDLWRSREDDSALCIVIDYKSSFRKVDKVLLEHGIQQQLPSYLNVIRRVPAFKETFGVKRLDPAGVFYVHLRGHFEPGANRREVLDSLTDSGPLAFQHQGLFDFGALRKLDQRDNQPSGDQFHYRLLKKGGPDKRTSAMESADFAALLDRAEAQLTRLGQRIYEGDVAVNPYRKGREAACDSCQYQAVCRIDPTTHEFRNLKAGSASPPAQS